MADRPHPTSIAGGSYDGTTFPYIPGSTLSIDPSLTLHREWTDEIDACRCSVTSPSTWTSSAATAPRGSPARAAARPLCRARGNYKLHCHRIDRPIQAANTLIGDPQRFIDDAVQFRQFCCPACGGLIENEVCRAQDPVLRDIELEVE
jgi:hypothetical protein